MFNRGSFNHLPFNRSFSVDILFSASLQGEGGLYAYPNVEYVATVTMQGEGELSAAYIREYIVSAVLQGEGVLTANVVRERLYSALLQGDGELKAAASRFHIDEIEVLGPFAPGDKIVIDSAKLLVKKNGSAIGYEGEFFNLNPGGNHIVYTDTATGRTVQIRITHRDCFI